MWCLKIWSMRIVVDYTSTKEEKPVAKGTMSCIRHTVQPCPCGICGQVVDNADTVSMLWLFAHFIVKILVS